MGKPFSLEAMNLGKVREQRGRIQIPIFYIKQIEFYFQEWAC